MARWEYVSREPNDHFPPTAYHLKSGDFWMGLTVLSVEFPKDYGAPVLVTVMSGDVIKVPGNAEISYLRKVS